MKKNILIPLVITVVLLLGILIVFLIKKDMFLADSRGNDPEIEKLVKIEQAEVTSFVFVTQESSSDHRLNLNVTPFFTLAIDEKEIESFSLTNFKGVNSKGHEVLLIHPTDLALDTVNRNFLFTVSDSINLEDLQSQGESIEYLSVSDPTKFNEVLKNGLISPYFDIIIKDVASVDYKAILDRDGLFDGAKYLEYSEIPLNELDTEIQFDIEIGFTDGEKYSKRFEVAIIGESFKTESSPVFPITAVE